MISHVITRLITYPLENSCDNIYYFFRDILTQELQPKNNLVIIQNYMSSLCNCRTFITISVFIKSANNWFRHHYENVTCCF